MIYEKFPELKYKYRNREFWCRGYYVDTAGKNAKKIEEYIKHQLEEDKADIVRQAFFGPVTPRVPASILQLHTDVSVVADEAALSKSMDLL